MNNPYEGYKVYGPYYHSKEGRQYIALVSKEHRTSTSYARYLLSMKLGRLLSVEEQVDHIDNNKMNDIIENLQILSPGDNVRKSHPGGLFVELICPQCSIVFIKPANLIIHQYRKGKPCCSRSCSGKYQHSSDFKQNAGP